MLHWANPDSHRFPVVNWSGVPRSNNEGNERSVRERCGYREVEIDFRSGMGERSQGRDATRGS